MNSKNLQDLFDNLQDGTVLAFYKSGLIGSIIPFFTRENKGEEPPHHVGIVYEVKRNKKRIAFKLSEQGFHGGQYRDVEINKFNDTYYTTDKYFLKQKKVEMSPIKMTSEQIKRGIEDAIAQIGVKYGFTRLVLGAEFIERFLPKNFRRNLFLRLNKKNKLRICSTHIAFNLNKAGFNIPLDDIYSPLELIKIIQCLK